MHPISKSGRTGHDDVMGDDAPRRFVLLAIGGAAVASAGCVGDNGGNDQFEPQISNESGNENETTTDNTDDSAETTADDPIETPVWPAVEVGEQLTGFDDDIGIEGLDSDLEGDPDEVRTGDEALRVRSDGSQAGVSVFFPDGLDLDGWDTSLAVKAESINRIAIEFHAPEFGNHLTSFRRLPDDNDEWMRVDFGYDEKQGEPDLANVTELRIIGFASEDGPTQFLLDDLRRVEAVGNGKAVLACYGGHETHYELAAPFLKERGWPGTVAVNPERIGGSNRMTVDQLEELQARGWDVCPAPSGSDGLSGLPREDQQRTLVRAQDTMVREGFEDGAAHFFAPDWRRLDPTNHELVREQFETGFVFGSSTTGLPPTAPHLIPMSWGPALHGGIRRQINIADQYHLLVVLRIPRLVEDEDDLDANSMLLDDFVHLLDHLETRGLDVITPTEIADGTFETLEPDDGPMELVDGVVFHGGESHEFAGAESARSDEFSLADGLLVLSFEHEGGGTFEIDIDPVDGEIPHEAVTETHRSGGTSVTVTAEGSYELDVHADGDWTVDLDQPEIHSDDVHALPVEESGAGSAFIGPIWVEDDGRLTATHEGAETFRIDLYGADGSWEQIVHQSGEFDSSRSFRGPGVCWLNVEASGDWTVEIA